jgi:hypothetical protein
MAASQNVRAAVSGGWAAIVAGVVVVAVSFAMVPAISQLGQPVAKESPSDPDGGSSEGDDV